MGSGGTIQLASFGAQDLYLTSRPQITFWKSVHRRHTLFAVEPIKQDINGSVGFGRKFTVSIAKNGDLLHRIMLEITLPDLGQLVESLSPELRDTFTVQYRRNVGLYLLKNIELDIGGQKIERHTSEWLDCWLNLTTPDSKKQGLMDMIGHDPSSPTFDRTLYVPLQFFFNRHAGLALPLVAMTFHDVKLHFELRSFTECILVGEKNPTLTSQQTRAVISYQKQLLLDNLLAKLETSSDPMIFDVYADMVFLDTMERKHFSSKEHEYLIEQTQYLGQELVTPYEVNKKVPIPFVNPVKELVWVYTSNISQKDPLQYLDILKEMKIMMNGNERLSSRKGKYFKTVQPWQHHTAIPDKAIYVYSFGTAPEEWQPSGTTNFTKLESAHLWMNLDWSKYIDASGNAMIVGDDATYVTSSKNVQGGLHVFALSYNIFRVADGLGGLSY